VPGGPEAPGGADTGPSVGFLRRQAVAFGRFWWDFLAGDAPGLLVGSAVVLGLIAALVAGGADVAAYTVAPLLVVAVLVISVWRATRH
jgi:hypothetical protein